MILISKDRKLTSKDRILTPKERILKPKERILTSKVKNDKKIEDLMYQNIKSVDRETYSNQQLIDYYLQFINID